jgi:hypothetical protein
MLSHPFERFLTGLKNASGRQRGIDRNRRRKNRHASALRDRGTCRSAVEALEDRSLLAAAGAAFAPTFVLAGHAPHPGTPSSVTPGFQQGTAGPITPAQMQTAYGVNLISFGGVQGTGQGQTIAIVDAYNDPNIIADAQAFSTQFGLPQFNVSGGPTLQVLNEFGGTTLPSNANPAGTWDVEESLDVEWAHAIAPQANIILFEANTNYWGDLADTEQTAAGTAGVSVVSNSWGGGELPNDTGYDSTFVTPAGHQGVTFLASAGDYGAPALYPAVSPNVVAVGGTTLNVDSSGNYLSESAWTDGGGGISLYESQPAYQTGKINGANPTQRTAPDISMDADLNTGVDVLDTFYSSSYFEVGGTSLSSPMMAGLVAIANQGRALNGLSSLDGESQTLPALYDIASGNFHDITTGDNGWPAGPGYDLATGLGTPIANNLVPALAAYQSTVTSPAAITIYGSNSYTFSGSSISMNDPAATGNSDSLSLSVADGTLALGSTAGLTFFSGANGTSSMTVTGTPTNLNAALDGLVYTPTASIGFAGFVQDFLQVSVHDANNNQNGVARVNITVIGPPQVNLPVDVTVQAGSQLDVGGFGIGDVGASNTSDSITLTVANGNLTLSPTTGVTITAGANASSSMTLNGTLTNLRADINANLFSTNSGLVYAPNAGFTGTDSLQITVANSFDNMTGSATLPIVVYSAIGILAPPNWSATEGYSSYSAANVTVLDPAASGNSDSLTLSASNGTIGFQTTTGLVFTAGSNNSSSFTVTGTLANLNWDLYGLSYTPKSFYIGSDTMRLTLADAGNNTSSSVAIPVTVSAPPITAPSVDVPDDTVVGALENGFNFLIYGAIRLFDTSAVGNSDSLTLSATNGTISFQNLPGDLKVTAGTIGSSSVTLNGPLSSLSILSNQLIHYTPNPGYVGPDWLKVALADSGTGLSASNTVIVDVVPGAFVYAPGFANVLENNPYTFTGNIGIIDAGVVGTSDSLALSVYNGSLTLGSTAGLTFTAGSNNSSSITVTGTLASLNAAVDGLVFTPNSGYTGNTRLTVSAYDSVDRGGDFLIVYLQVNAAPSITAPLGVSLNENSSYPFSGGSIKVVDPAGLGNDSLSLSVSDGTLLLATTNGLTFSSGANGSSSMTVVGTLYRIDAALNGLVYTPNALYSGPDTLRISDENTFDTFTASAAVALTINAPPAITAPATVIVSENGSYSFVGGSINLADAAATGASDSLTLSASDGMLTLGSTTGLTFSSGANATSAMTVSGTLANLNAALNGLVYSANSGFTGSDSLSLAVTDSGDGLSGSGMVAIAIDAPPAVSAPSAVALNENSFYIFSGGSIGLTDTVAIGNSDSLTLSVNAGKLTLGSTSGLTFTSGANGSSSMTVSGTLTNLSAALAGLTYSPNAGFSGSDALQISLLDSGDGMSGAASTAFTVKAPPSVTAPGTAALNENTPYSFSGTISVTDAAANGAADSLKLSVVHGTLTLSTTTGLTFAAGNNGTSSFTVTGTVANLDAALNGLVYTPTTGYAGSDALSISVVDPVDNQSASAGVALTVIPPPSISAPASASLNPNGLVVFSPANGNAITLTDTGPASNGDSLTVTVNHGTVTLSTTAGLLVTAGANGSSSVTVTGPLANLNAALNGLTYKPIAGYSGSDALAVSLKNMTDGMSRSASVAVAVSNPPAITAPATAGVPINSTLVFSSSNNNSITVSDVNAGSTVESLSLTATNGTLALGSTTGITFSSGANGSASMTINGTLANLNNALAGLTFTPAQIGAATVVLSYTDAGDGLLASATIKINVSKALTKLGQGAPATALSPTTGQASSANGSMGGGTTAPSSLSTSATNSSMPPDEETTQWAGVTAAVAVLNG